jgi:RNA polymerase I-specific transcription initiation factor RRN3
MASADTSEPSASPPRPSLKRSRSESDAPTTPDAQQKRQRVTFSPNVSVRVLETPGEKPLALIKEEVRIALERHRKGDDGMYNRLKDIFLSHPNSKNAPSPLSYRKHLAAVTTQAYHMGRELDCSDLLRALLGSFWLERDEQVWADFQRFLAALLTVHGVYLPTILNWLVDRLSECQYTRFKTVQPC